MVPTRKEGAASESTCELEKPGPPGDMGRNDAGISMGGGKLSAEVTATAVPTEVQWAPLPTLGLGGEGIMEAVEGSGSEAEGSGM